MNASTANGPALQILFYNTDRDRHPDWMRALHEALPGAAIRIWQPGDTAPADYALVWQQPAEVLQPERGLKAVFNLGAGRLAASTLLRELNAGNYNAAAQQLLRWNHAGSQPSGAGSM